MKRPIVKQISFTARCSGMADLYIYRLMHIQIPKADGPPIYQAEMPCILVYYISFLPRSSTMHIYIYIGGRWTSHLLSIDASTQNQCYS